MSYESADYINQLNPNLPLGSDSVSEGDIHLRLLKEVLQQSFPNVNEPVNAIHSGAEPTLKSAGTVWYDTSTGLIKMYDGSQWLNMAHGSASGVGQLLKVDWFEWGGENFRESVPKLLKDFTVNPLSDTSTYFVNATAEVSSWGYENANHVSVKFRDDTTDIDLLPQALVCGFDHISDSGNFEIRGMMNVKFRYQNHPGTPWELALYAWNSDWQEGGGGITRLCVEVLEIE